MILSLSLAFLAAAGAAPANDPVKRTTETGSRLAKRANSNVWDTEKTRKVQAEFGDCVIGKHLAAAQHFVLTPDLEKTEWRKDVNKVADGYCLSIVTATNGDVEMSFPLDTMRYALAEALIRKEFPAGAPSIADAAPLDQPRLTESDYQPEPGKKLRQSEIEKLSEAREKRIGLIFLAGFGECVVRSDPVLSHKLLMTEATSPEEAAAFKALFPNFGACLPAGQSLAFPKATLRGTIAMNYYRLANAPRAAVPSTQTQGAAR